MATKYFPQLSSILKIEQLPEQLNFAEEGITNLLDGLGFKNLEISNNSTGSGISYKIEIVCYKELVFEILGTGLKLSLNPNFNTTGSTIIPVSISFNLEIKKYARNFKLNNFAFTPQDFYQLLFKIFEINDRNLVLLTKSIFLNSTNPLNDFASILNSKYSLTLTLPLSNDEEEGLEELLLAIENNNNFNLSEANF